MQCWIYRYCHEEETGQRSGGLSEKDQAESEYLMTLINDVLDISRIESGKLEYKPVLVDLRDMTDTVLSIARGYMENRDLNFSVSREET